MAPVCPSLRKVPGGFLDRPQQSFGNFWIPLNPISQFFERALFKFQAHASSPPSFQKSSDPAFLERIASRSRLAFSGAPIRRAVVSSACSCGAPGAPRVFRRMKSLRVMPVNVARVLICRCCSGSISIQPGQLVSHVGEIQGGDVQSSLVDGGLAKRGGNHRSRWIPAVWHVIPTVGSKPG